MKNIVFVTESMTTIGGVVRVISTWSNYFSNANQNVEIVSVNSGEPYFLLNSKIKFTIEKFKFRNKLFKIISIPGNTIKLYKFLKSRNGANIIFNKSLYIEPLWILKKLGLTFNTNLIYMHHGGSRGFRSFYLSRAGTRHRVWMMFDTFDKVVCLYDDEKDYPHSVKQDKLNFIPNPLPFAIKQNNTSNKINQVLSVGRITQEKGIETLIRAWSLLDPSIRNGWRLKIVGEGPDKEKFIGLTANLCLHEIEFHDGTPDVSTFYEESKIFVIPSRVEGFGMTIIEAMAKDCCVISSKTLGGTELIKNETTGLLVEIDSAPDLASKLKIIMNDDVIRSKFAKNAQCFVEKFEIESVAKNWKDILK